MGFSVVNSGGNRANHIHCHRQPWANLETVLLPTLILLQNPNSLPKVFNFEHIELKIYLTVAHIRREKSRGRKHWDHA